MSIHGTREAEAVLKCQHCENNVDLPFRCPFCAGYFCANHRLPENHSCPELWKVLTRGPPPLEKGHPPAGEGRPPPIYPPRFKRPGWTSSTETLHLVLSALLVMAVGLSMRRPVTQWVFFFLREPETFLSSALVFAFTFSSHELAHKAAAKQFGLWAEFRMNLLGAVLTLLSIAPTPIKIITPGAVMIAGAVSKKTMGIIALAGPFTSIVLASLFIALQLLVPTSSFTSVILTGAELGAWIAFLNLIPFGVMDGSKVFWWNKIVWAISFFMSIILLAVALMYLRF